MTLLTKNRLVFFTPQLSGYLEYNLEYLNKNYHTDILLFYYKSEKDAPYNFELSKSIEYCNIEEYSEDEIINKAIGFNPELVVVSGWNNTLFRKVGKKFKSKSIQVIMSVDNLWKKSLKQMIFLLFGKYFIKLFADYIWVPGYPQYYYAKRLGFKENEIILNYYNGNYLNKNVIGLNSLKLKEKNYPKSIVFIGRLVQYKMPLLLAKVFNEIQQEGNFKDWRLIFVGSGVLKDKIEDISNNNIIVKPFMQPKELDSFIVNQGVFCLPSHNEHWGLVVHEAASLGLPLVLSDTVGASSTFLLNGYNGYSFESRNRSSLKAVLNRIMEQTDKQLIKKAKNSLEMSKRIDCDIWSSSLLSVL